MNKRNPFELYTDDHALHRRGVVKRGGEVEIAPEELRGSQFTPSVLSPADRLPMRMLLACSMLILIVLSSRAYVLQGLQASSLRGAAEGNRISEVRHYAPRGVITDLHGEVIAKNTVDFQVLIDPTTLPKEREADTLDFLSEEFDILKTDLKQILKEARISGRAKVVVENVHYEKALQSMVKIQEYTGIRVEEQYRREYPYKEIYAHILGYTSKISAEEYDLYRQRNYALDTVVGKSGIEKRYEEELHGKDGFTRNEVDFRGNVQRVVSQQPTIPGTTLRLTIDDRLQRLLYTKLEQVANEKQLPGASAVAIDPRDGSVRALVSYPSYDNNLFTGGISQELYTTLIQDERNPLFHRAISGEYPSGSTFKIVVTAAGIEEKIVTPQTTIVSTGGLRVGEYFFPDWRAGGHGVTNAAKALADSVNTYYYLLGGGNNTTSTGLGVERIVSYGRKFGLSDITGIDLPGESDGFLPSKAWKEEFKNEPWYLGDTYHLAIGQGDILVTPLQVAVFTSIVANGGIYYQPHVVDSMIDPESAVEDTVEPIVKNAQVVSRETINAVREGMRQTITVGSARSLSTALPVTSAGKTGTAQFGKKDKTHSWFTVFAPYEEPTIALTVLVEEGGGANDTAVPIAREVLKEYFTPQENTENEEKL